MGVHGLWELLAPVGRRVSVETLAGKKLAIDASIWMIQFMKAMRDEKGEMVRNAHILGFFRRICKLLFLRTKPVFVFDGGTPALKRRTVIARRRQRENAQAKIRKTAEKLLLNHLKEMRLKELAKDLENQRQTSDTKGKKIITGKKCDAENNSEGDEKVLGGYNQEALDEMLAASLAAEEDKSFTGDASTSGAGTLHEDDDGDEDDEIILPTMHGKVDPAVLAALPPSMQLDLLVQASVLIFMVVALLYQKVKKAPARFSELQIQAYLKTVAFRREIGEVQKSAAGRGIGGIQTSRIASEANREFIFSSSFTGDKQTLTSAGLERNSNKKHQAPTGHPPSDSLGVVGPTNRPNTVTGLMVDEPKEGFDDDVETYLDERGRVRVSRLRAMGLRMTRDLQRNLDLMKESEEIVDTNKNVKHMSTIDENVVNLTRKSVNKTQFLKNSDLGDGTMYNKNEESTSRNRSSIEVSFEAVGEDECFESDDDLFSRLVTGDPILSTSADNDLSKKHSSDSASDCEWEEGSIPDKDNIISHDLQVRSKPESTSRNRSSIEVSFKAVGEDKCFGSDDDLFSGLVTGDPILRTSADNDLSKKHSSDSASDCEWEEGSIPDKDYIITHDLKVGSKPDIVEHGVNDDGEVEWEEGSSDIPQRASPSPPEFNKTISKGVQEEEFDFQEAIRRSIEDLRYQKEIDVSTKDVNFKKDREKVSEAACVGSDHQGKDRAEPKLSSQNVLQTNNSSFGNITTKISDPSGSWLAPLVAVNPDKREILVDKPNESYPERKTGIIFSQRNFVHVEPVTPTEAEGIDLIKEKPAGTSPMVDVTHADTQQFGFESGVNYHSTEKTETVESFVKGSTIDFANIQKNSEEVHNEEQIELTEAGLEEEMLILDKERTDLGDEQRKHERNAESVSSEMFAECQELLQMFGLPYIIAPMEAEAQCAYMELTNLVDGVVTDDSDVFLFGARSVYKNIFDDRKYVETYFMKDIENELGITREKLIRMAMLLGSDYTEGISGIGIVNAVEVVNAFPEEDGLHKFREWIESPDPSILGKADLQAGSRSRKKGSKAADIDASCSNNNNEGASFLDNIDNEKQIFMEKHRNVSKNWHIPSTFPSEAVFSAYTAPQVDKSTEPFAWGKPDQRVLRKLCWEKFGWGTQKADELLVPVLKEYNKHETQLRLEAFYTFNERFAKIRSKRIKKAVKGITGNKSLELMDDSVQDDSKSRKKAKVSQIAAGNDLPGEQSITAEAGVGKEETNSTEKSASKQSRKRRNCFPSEVGNSESPIKAVGRQNTNKGSIGKGRGRARGQSVRRGRMKQNSGFENADTSNSDEGNNCDSKQEVQVEKHEGPHEVRRSARHRKAVKYTLNDLEIDDTSRTSQDNGNSSDNEGIVVGASSSPSKTIHLMVKDPSKEESSPCVYVEIEGAKAETRMGLLGSDQYGEAELSQDYLKMGGGFCLEGDDDKDKDPSECASSPARAIIFENHNTSHYSGNLEDADHDIDVGPAQLVSSTLRASNPDCPNATTDENISGVAISKENIEGDGSGTRSIRSLSLSAMPYLKRKRRKG
ncbi:hypothetical protein LguiA_019559 [Lonicera macranthoides]